MCQKKNCIFRKKVFQYCLKYCEKQLTINNKNVYLEKN